jgi:hypothetical protein
MGAEEAEPVEAGPQPLKIAMAVAPITTFNDRIFREPPLRPESVTRIFQLEGLSTLV